jgi:hypothetical protein|tara:strand:- start:8181 stop:8825 length:645 start_codon:yes stop_codon:yes gene_type:complete
MEKVMKQSKLDRILSWIAWAIIIVWILVIIIVPTEANENTNVSGDNTIISGGYDSTSSTTYESGSSSNTTSTSTTNNTSNIKSFPPTATSSPAVSGIDVCNLGHSLGVQSSFIGLSSSGNHTDETCERIKLARELATVHQMKVAGIAILCQDPRVFSAMEAAGTPCPFEGQIGADATRLWSKYDLLRPDYKEYKERMETKEKIQAEQVMYDTGR